MFATDRLWNKSRQLTFLLVTIKYTYFPMYSFWRYIFAPVPIECWVVYRTPILNSFIYFDTLI